MAYSCSVFSQSTGILFIHNVRVLSMNSLLGAVSELGGVTNPKCGSTYSVPQGEGLSFFCHPSLYGRYVTIRSLQTNSALTVCEVEVYSERRGILFVDAYDNDGIMAVVMIFSYRV